YTFPDQILLFLLICGAYAFTALPYSSVIANHMQFVEVAAFIFYCAIIFNLKSAFYFRLRISNIVIFLWILFAISILYSSFVINWSVNANITSIFKIASYIIIIWLFFFSFSQRLYINDK